MKTPVLSFVLLLAAASTTHAASRTCFDLFRSRASLDQAFNNIGPLRGAENKIEDWNSDRGFNRMLSEAEKMGQVRSVFDTKLDTRLYYTATGLPDANGRVPMIDPNAEAVVIFVHGSGTSQSGGANFIQNMNRLANIGVAAMSFDLPFHSEGPTKDQFNNADYFMKWVGQIVAIAKASGKPVYMFGHSFGPDVIAEFVNRNPFGVDGIDLVSMASFNRTLDRWQTTHTDKMKFGGEVPENTMGGIWAAGMSEQFKWNKSGGRNAPTLVNPNLKVEILWGDREEYAPAPTGGKSKTPIGKNTYDLPAAIRPFFPGANITIASNIGHYIFDHVDANGQNTVMQSVYRMIGFHGDEAEAAKLIAQRVSARPYSAQLEFMMATDKIFKSWLISTNQLQLAQALGRASNNVQAEKLMQAYKTVYRERVLAQRHNK